MRFWARDPRFEGDDADFYGRCINCDRWTIDFGDGQTASGEVSRSWIRADHVYPGRGEYTATLTVYGPGGEASDQEIVRVWFD
jgi:PKD repeat protein